MPAHRLLSLILLAAAGPAVAVEHPRLAIAGSYDMGTGEAAEIVSVQHHRARAILSNSEDGIVDLLDLSDPTTPRRIRRIDFGLAGGEALTSVAVHPHRAYFAAAIEADDWDDPGRVEFRDLEGAILGSVLVGMGPDAVAIDPSGRWCGVACEGEGVALIEGELHSPPGSVAIIDLAAGPAAPTVRLVELPDLSQVDGITTAAHQRQIERDVQGGKDEALIPLPDPGPAWLEPEYLAFSPDGAIAYVSLQEHNAIVAIASHDGRILGAHGLGRTEHAADLTADGRVDFGDTLSALREPDGIAVSPDGRFVLTADEGDTDPHPDGGGRTLSVVDAATGRMLADTGGQLDLVASAAGCYPDRRSPKKGSEPESVVAFGWRGETYAAVALERADAIALVHIADDGMPTVIQVLPLGAGHRAPEGLAIYHHGGADYLLTANEGSGTLSVLALVP